MMRKRVSEDWQFFNMAVMLRGFAWLGIRSREASDAWAGVFEGGAGRLGERTQPPRGDKTGNAGGSGWTGDSTQDRRAATPPDTGRPDDKRDPDRQSGPFTGPGAKPVDWPQIPSGLILDNPPAKQVRWVNFMLIGALLGLVAVWCIMLLKQQDPPPIARTPSDRLAAPKTERGEPRALPTPDTAMPADSTLFVTLQRNAYLHGNVVTIWFFESQEAAAPLRQVCGFHLPSIPAAEISEGLRSFDIEQRPGRAHANPGYLATGLTLSEWTRAASFCRWHGTAASPAPRRPPAPRRST